jgi:hypothetical protein
VAWREARGAAWLSIAVALQLVRVVERRIGARPWLVHAAMSSFETGR